MAWCHKRLRRRRVDKRSFRIKRSGKAQVLVACPTGHYHPGRPKNRQCDIGLVAVSVRVPARGAQCPRGYKKP